MMFSPRKSAHGRAAMRAILYNVSQVPARPNLMHHPPSDGNLQLLRYAAETNHALFHI